MATLQAADCPAPRPPAIALNAGAVLLLGGLTLFGTLTGGADQPVLDVAVLGLSVLLVPLMLRRPVPGTLALAVLAALSGAANPALGLAVLNAARTRPASTAARLALVAVAASAVQGWWRPAGGLSWFWWLALVAAAYAALVGWGQQWQSRRALIGSLRERADRAEAEQAAKVAQARQLERTRIAAEMHDVLAHRLSLLSTYAGAVEYRPDAAPEQLAKAAAVLRSTAHQALEDLREVIGVLRADELTPDGPCRPQPVLDDLPTLVQEAREAGQPVELVEHLPDGDQAPGGTSRTVYRVVQEGLTNARKHAAGQPVTVLVTGRPGEGLRVEVSNPLGAATATPGSGTGLVGLSERMAFCGGRIEHSRDGDRFRLQAWLPWPAA
jgi:signal transduction histidine kinase